jgi:hypothetical protein
MGCRLDDQGIRVRFQTGPKELSLLYSVQMGSGVHTASYPIGTEGTFPAVKLTTHLLLVPKLRIVELYLHSTTHLHSVVLN